MGDLPTDPPIVVHGLVAGTPPYRRVEIRHEPVGHAYGLADVAEFARRVGLEDLNPLDPEMVSWHGGGPEDWTL
jgi:hypothetical protein